MLAGLEMPPAVEAERVITAVLADLESGSHPDLVVDSPPGADKRALVVRAAAKPAIADEPLIVIAHTHEHLDGLIDRLARKATEPHMEGLSAADYRPSAPVKGHHTVRGRQGRRPRRSGRHHRAGQVRPTVTEGSWPWAIFR